MYLDEHDSLQLSIHKVYEPAETRFFGEHVKEGMVILDVGANIGYYTLQFARAAGAKGRVYAFEPDPENFKLLQKNVQLNGYTNVILIPKAVSDVTGTLKLYSSPENKGDHKIYDSGEARQPINIESTRLDDYFEAQKTPVDLIKMDIQGAEYRALLGTQGVLRRNPHATVVTEFWPSGLKRSGASAAGFLDLLLAQEFDLFEIREAHAGVEPVNRAYLLGKYREDRPVDMTNLMCRRDPAKAGRAREEATKIPAA
jgi:FkbM family methyltransferase